MINTIRQLFEKKIHNFKESIEKISYDKENDQSLCHWKDSFYNFDRITAFLLKGMNQTASVDMLAFGKKQIVFVEFKAGKNVKKDKKQLQLKILESLLLFEMIVSNHLNPSSKELKSLEKVYIVVYDPQKIPPSQTRTKYMENHLDSRQVRFGVDKYQDTFLSETKTLSCGEEFKKVLRRYGCLIQSNQNYTQ